MRVLLLAALLGLPGLAGAEPPQAAAARVRPGAVRLDGRLDDDAWRAATPITSFSQKEPVEGAPGRDALDVRFVYDDDALYVGVRVAADGGRAVQAPLGRRDDADQAEQVLVALDTYLDLRTSYTFGVTAAGVRVDRYHATDSESDYDEGFDPVWEARTARDAAGWSAEMRIPFSQLRFRAQDAQVFGLDVVHFVPSRNERAYWVLVGRKESGWASRFGRLVGIAGIRPSRRVELLPYAAAGARLTGRPDRRDPFDDGRNLAGRLGGEAKIGLGPNLTLEATVHPDFGQVEADPAEVNLSAFETTFAEKRPFFLEGAQLLRGRGANFFYSRRIGAAPRGPAEGDFVDYPRSTTILGAAKLTGRLQSGTSIGALGALTGRAEARTFDLAGQALGRTVVAPRAAYAIARVEQELGPTGSTVGAMVTLVRRDLPECDALAGLLPRAALTGGADALLRFRDGAYQLRAWAGGSHVEGEPGAIATLQRSSARYFQRPDARRVTYDPTRRSLDGWTGGINGSRNSGRHWLWEAQLSGESPGVELNDLGRIATADGLVGQGTLTWRETRPGRLLHAWSTTAFHIHEWSFDHEVQANTSEIAAEGTLRNFWRASAAIGVDRPTLDERLTRGGPLMGYGGDWYASAQVLGREAARTQWSATLFRQRYHDGGGDWRLSGGLQLRPRPRWALSLTPSYQHEVNGRQYVDTLEGGPAATFGKRYVFATVDRTTLFVDLRLTYAFQPDLTLDVYMEPFAASGRYGSFGELPRPRAHTLALYAPGAAPLPTGDRDFDVRSYRSNVVLRWEWRLGSTLYAVWQQDRAAARTLGTRAGLHDLVGSFGAPGDHVLALKATLWIPLR